MAKLQKTTSKPKKAKKTGTKVPDGDIITDSKGKLQIARKKETGTIKIKVAGRRLVIKAK